MSNKQTDRQRDRQTDRTARQHNTTQPQHTDSHTLTQQVEYFEPLFMIGSFTQCILDHIMSDGLAVVVFFVVNSHLVYVLLNLFERLEKGGGGEGGEGGGRGGGEEKE
jgi:hypothetical protein